MNDCNPKGSEEIVKAINKLSLEEIADRFKNRECFPESNKRAKELLNNINIKNSLYDISKKYFGENSIKQTKEEWEKDYVNSYDKPKTNKSIKEMEKLQFITEVKKDLYKTKEIAKFSHYCKGVLYYNIKTLNSVYQFPIYTTEEKIVSVTENIKTLTGLINYEFETLNLLLSEDLGNTSFENEIPGKLLIRWIDKAINKDEFIAIETA